MASEKTSTPRPKVILFDIGGVCIDAQWLFNDMMAAARAPDPWMYPALKALKEDGRYIVAALSNTGDEMDALRDLFDVFVSSAHEGLRKPDPEIYQLALERVDEFARKNAGAKAKI
ncbi:hypothetical protein N0V88_002513 [Collariella sp. IMI 366227]|nr:hypothetical protein N0V88_002513 [Collariella sp. IMI 366227]